MKRKYYHFAILCSLIFLASCSGSNKSTKTPTGFVLKPDSKVNTFFYKDPFLKVRTSVIHSLQDADMYIKDARDYNPNTLLLVARYENIHTLFMPQVLELNVYISQMKTGEIRAYTPKPDPKQFTAHASIERYETYIHSLIKKKLNLVKTSFTDDDGI